MTFSLKYVGKSSKFAGKTLWEILGNLKDFGVGRIIVRNSYLQRFKEPCYLKILEVTTRPHWEEPNMKKYRPPNDLRDKDVSVSLVFNRYLHFLCKQMTKLHSIPIAFAQSQCKMRVHISWR